MDQPAENDGGQVGMLKNAAEIVGAVQTLIAAAGAVVAFIRERGGVDDILLEIGFLAIACYVGAWITLPLAFGALAGLENMTKRRTTTIAIVTVIGLAVVGGGLFARYVLFAPDLTDDLDDFGRGFGILLGLAVVASPLVALWYFKGSKSAAGQP